MLGRMSPSNTLTMTPATEVMSPRTLMTKSCVRIGSASQELKKQRRDACTRMTTVVNQKKN